jgi:hypothetical protein
MASVLLSDGIVYHGLSNEYYECLVKSNNDIYYYLIMLLINKIKKHYLKNSDNCI